MRRQPQLRSGNKVISGWAVVVALGWLAGCYNPKLQDGVIGCSADTPPKCPSGFVCRADNLCYRTSAGGADGGASGGRAGSSGRDAGVGGEPMCAAPIAGCQSMTTPGLGCDPVCNTGCSCPSFCNTKRVENPNRPGGMGFNIDCVPGPAGAANLGDDCTTGSGSECRPGLVCLAEASAACGFRCAKFCRTDEDCPASRCVVSLDVDLIGTATSALVSACDVPHNASCSPFFGEGRCMDQQGRAPPNYGCYPAGAADPDKAVCDCAGSADEGAACDGDRFCKPGLFCQANHCRRVCPLMNSNAAKTICGASNCRPIADSKVYGYCEVR